MRKFKPSQAFSLVELSIVLVILGLLVGGVLSGQSLIRAAELRSISTDANRFYSATYAFRDKYFALPGDMPNAESFWGAWSTTGTPASVAGAKNGTGDGAFGANGLNQYERSQFFRHLALAGLIEGSYAGSFDEPAQTYAPSVNVPKARIGSSARIVVNNYQSALGIYGRSGNYIIIQEGTSPFSLISPKEMWSIDTKMDDSIPSTGMVMGIAEDPVLVNRNCTSNDDWVAVGAIATTYNLTVDSKQCWPLFWFQ